MVELRLAWRSIWQVRYQSKYAFFCYGCLFSAAGNSRKRKIRFLWISWFRFFLFSLCRSKKKFDRFVEVVVKVGKADLIIQFADWPVFFFFFFSRLVFLFRPDCIVLLLLLVADVLLLTVIILASRTRPLSLSVHDSLSLSPPLSLSSIFLALQSAGKANVVDDVRFLSSH